MSILWKSSVRTFRILVDLALGLGLGLGLGLDVRTFRIQVDLACTRQRWVECLGDGGGLNTYMVGRSVPADCNCYQGHQQRGNSPIARTRRRIPLVVRECNEK